VFPGAIADYQQRVKDAADVNVWRKTLVKSLMEKLVQGEAVQERLNFEVAPQEEAKEEPDIAKRMFKEAVQLLEDQKLYSNDV
jgi:hypothetical protein